MTSQMDRELAAEISLLSLDVRRSLVARMEWILTARPDQLPPPNYSLWLLLAGRGSGKTRTGAEEMWFHGSVSEERIAIVGPTNNDVRKTCFEGESGLLATIPKGLIDNYNRSSLELWLKNGSYFIGYSSEEPERLRGPQHHRAWCDELAAWKNAQEMWDMLEFGMRLGDNPQVVATTTPKPIKLVRALIKDPGTVVSAASTFDNAANLPPRYLQRLRDRYEGTRLGRQELYAELLTDVVGALWTPEMMKLTTELPTMQRVVVAVDPSGASDASDDAADEIGIVVAGKGTDGRGYILEDASLRASPAGWASRAIVMYKKWGADRVIGEKNFGGAMVESTIRNVDENVSYKGVHASRGKIVRAEPVAALYEQGKVSHYRNPDDPSNLSKLEDQMCSMTGDGYVGDGSPDKVDAAVWALSELFGTGKAFEWYVGK